MEKTNEERKEKRKKKKKELKKKEMAFGEGSGPMRDGAVKCGVSHLSTFLIF